MALQKHPKRSRMATFGPIMPARPRFKLKIGSNLRPSKPNLRPNVPGNAHLEPTMSSNTHLPCHKVLMSMMPKPKQSLMWSRTRIAIELKGLAAPGEALRNSRTFRCGFVQFMDSRLSCCLSWRRVCRQYLQKFWDNWNFPALDLTRSIPDTI